MTVAEWGQVKLLFEKALQVPEAERLSFVTAQAESPAVDNEVRSLLAAYQESPDFLESGARVPVSPPEERQSPLSGRMIGSWRLVREIGRGGMGVVWEAQRADRQYEQRAAVKLLAASLFSDVDIRRFRSERQILARLAHPGIARLLDGGTLEDGSPFLVMEYVDGLALDTWCENYRLGLKERLGLFLAICDAVEYAHRNLVIHRDLKPANILVTADGTPKLLDFGIARLIEPGHGDTGTGPLRVTPEFASPEQLRGEAVGTSTDIFSLGVLLYVLLTGRRPHTANDSGPLEMMRAVCQDEPAVPSSIAGEWAAELRGELDAIILQALRKNPDERYLSVRALADDLRAWQEGHPVSAIAPTPWRRCAWFLRRHKVESATAALAVLSLVAGTGFSWWQAGVAKQEKERAESRFRDMRRFSRSLLFELHDSIRDLPGSTAARNLLLERATAFLDNLARDPASDGSLRLELAEGYRRLGQVQGSSFSENVGRRDAAIASFRKAVQLAEQALPASGQNNDAAVVLLGAYDDLCNALWNNNQRPEAMVWYEKHRRLLADLEARHPTDKRLRAAIASSCSALAYTRAQGNDDAGAKDDYRKAAGIFASLIASGYSPAEMRVQYGFALKRLGAILIVENSLQEAETCYRRALGMEDAGLRVNPGDRKLRLNRTFTLSDLGLILKKRKDYIHSAEIYEEVLATRRVALGSDQQDLRMLSLTASAAQRLADVYTALRRHSEAIALSREALRLRDEGARVSKGTLERWDATAARISLCWQLINAGEDRAAGTARTARVNEASRLLYEVRPVMEGLGSGTNPSRAERAALEEYRELRIRLQRISLPEKSR